MALSDDEIRRRFLLPPCLPVLRELPTPHELKERKSSLHKIGEALGFEQWMWKSKRGILIACVVGPPTLYGIGEFWVNHIKLGYSYLAPFVRGWAADSALLDERIVVMPPRTPTPSPVDTSAEWPIGTVIANAYRFPEPQAETPALTLWRVTRTGHDPLYTGPRLYDTRWFPAGTRWLMASGNVMESLIELTSPAAIQRPDLVARRLRVPIDMEIQHVAESELPEGWAGPSFSRSTQRIGARWLESGSSGILCVPSAVVPGAHLYAMNPAHPDFRRLSVGSTIDLPQAESGLIA